MATRTALRPPFYTHGRASLLFVVPPRSAVPVKFSCQGENMSGQGEEKGKKGQKNAKSGGFQKMGNYFYHIYV